MSASPFPEPNHPTTPRTNEEKSRTKIALVTLLGAMASAPNSILAQTQSLNPAVRTDGDRGSGTPQPGSNSFTEGQACGRMEDAGFKDVIGLAKDDQGIWRGRAVRNGSPTSVALDYRGDVFGAAVAAADATATPGDVGATSGVAGEGTPGNPAGTAAGRAVDRTLGTNGTGANPGTGGPAR